MPIWIKTAREIRSDWKEFVVVVVVAIMNFNLFISFPYRAARSLYKVELKNGVIIELIFLTKGFLETCNIKKVNKKSRTTNGVLLPILNIMITYLITTTSILLFCALPSAVSLSATGFAAPNPFVVILVSGIPAAISLVLTASALCCDSVRLESALP